MGSRRLSDPNAAFGTAPRHEIMRSRTWHIVALGALVAACDPIQSRGLTLSPGPASQNEMRSRALELTERVAARHGLVPDPVAPFHEEEGWECHSRGLFRVCVIAIGGEVQFLFSEVRSSFSEHGRAVWHQLNHELRTAFGEASVRECRFARRPDPEAPEASVVRFARPASRARVAREAWVRRTEPLPTSVQEPYGTGTGVAG